MSELVGCHRKGLPFGAVPESDRRKELIFCLFMAYVVVTKRLCVRVLMGEVRRSFWLLVRGFNGVTLGGGGNSDAWHHMQNASQDYRGHTFFLVPLPPPAFVAILCTIQRAYVGASVPGSCTCAADFEIATYDTKRQVGLVFALDGTKLKDSHSETRYDL